MMQETHPEDFWVDAGGNRHQAWLGPARIVSLVPSLTELVCDLGLADQLVGRTGFCIHPRATVKPIPKVGGTKDVHLARLRELAPTHVIVNIDENRREDVAAIAEWAPHVIVTHPCVPADNLSVYRLLGGIFRRESEAQALEQALCTALADADRVGRALPPESVLYLIWREPWMTVARSTYISAMLATVGWHTVPVADAPRYPAFDWAAPWVSEAARVFLSSEPYRFQQKHVDEVGTLSSRPATLIDGEMVSWYGSRAVAGLRYLAALRRALAGLE